MKKKIDCIFPKFHKTPMYKIECDFKGDGLLNYLITS